MQIPKFRTLGKKLKILFVASEAAPFVKVGGLGEVMYALPKALRELGYDARVMIPKYATIDTKKFPLVADVQGIMPLTDDNDPHELLVSNVLRYEEDGKTVAYFLENMEYYEKRANVYGYKDDTTRWVLLSKGTLEFLKTSEWKPDIIVASDWQTGFIPNLMKTDYKQDPVISKIKVIFSIHNLKYQGLFDQNFIQEMEFDSGQAKIPAFFDPGILKLNGMRRGIMYADIINTVSPTYAREILSEEMGEKLNGLLSERRSELFGILNGIDMESLDPAKDSAIQTQYSVNNLDARLENKLALQKHFNLPQDKEKFVIGIVSRLTKQKGFDLLTEIIPPLLKNVDFQLVITGTGSDEYKIFFTNLQKQYPERVAVHCFFDSILPRMIFAGADAVLIPSKYEPSGLVQMEAMRYGAVPIVRKTGGLADSIEDFIPGKNKGTGFIFEEYDKFALLISVIRASETFKNKKEWNKLIKRAMTKDFSWIKSAKEYVRLFSLAKKAKIKKEAEPRREFER